MAKGLTPQPSLPHPIRQAGPATQDPDISHGPIRACRDDRRRDGGL